MNYTDFMAQLPENVQHLINQDDEPVNPKVMELVLALNKSGILTRMSGDLYGRDMVYVDFDRCFLTDFLNRHPGKLPGNSISGRVVMFTPFIVREFSSPLTKFICID